MSSKTDLAEAKSICCDFLYLLFDHEWDKATALLTDEFEAFLPHSGAIIMGPTNFIHEKRLYLKQHDIEIINLISEYDVWEMKYSVSTGFVTKTNNLNINNCFSAYFFELDHDNLITSITEYSAETYDAPKLDEEVSAQY